MGDLFLPDPIIFLTGHANLAQLELPSLNCRKFGQPFCWSFCLTEAIGANAFRLNTQAQWKMRNVSNIAHLKQNCVVYSRELPPPPPMCRMTDEDPEYEVEAIVEYQRSSTKTVQPKVK